MGQRNANQKHEREAVRTIERTFPGVSVDIEVRRSSTHKWLVASKDGVTVRTTLSSSPGIDSGSLNDILRRWVRRAFAEHGIQV